MATTMAVVLRLGLVAGVIVGAVRAWRWLRLDFDAEGDRRAAPWGHASSGISGDGGGGGGGGGGGD
jgi:hypothetical protein